MHKLNFKTGIVFFILLSLAIVWLSVFTSPLVSDFYKTDKKYDILFMGTSESFTTFNPYVLHEYGITSYNRGRMTQPAFMTYYYLLDAIDTVEVNTVVFEPHALYDDTKIGSDLKKELVDSTLNNMRFSKYKVQLIWNCLPKDTRLQNLLYLDKYHGRWETMWDMEKERWQYFLRRDGEGENLGFQPWTTYQALEGGYPDMEFRTAPREGYEIPEVSKEYLEKIYQVCVDNNIRFIVAKSVYPCNESDVGLAQYMEQWCDERDVPYINYMNMYEELGIVEDEDDADGGFHLNENGADKVSHHFAKWVLDNGYHRKLGE